MNSWFRGCSRSFVCVLEDVKPVWVVTGCNRVASYKRIGYTCKLTQTTPSLISLCTDEGGAFVYLIASYLVIRVCHTNPWFTYRKLGIEYIWVLSWIGVHRNGLYMYYLGGHALGTSGNHIGRANLGMPLSLSDYWFIIILRLLELFYWKLHVSNSLSCWDMRF